MKILKALTSSLKNKKSSGSEANAPKADATPKKHDKTKPHSKDNCCGGCGSN